MRRRGLLLTAIFLATALAVLVGALYTPAFRSWLGAELGERASLALGRPVTLEVDRFLPHSLELSLARVRIAGAGPDDGPLLEVSEVTADGLWLGLLRGRLELAELRIGRLTLDLSDVGPGDEAEAEPADTGWRLDRLVVRRLTLADGAIRYAPAELPLALAAEQVELRAAWRRQAGEYRGELATSAGAVRWSGVGDLPVTLRSGFTLSPERLALEELEATTPGLTVAGGGEIRAGAVTAFAGELSWRATAHELGLPALAELGARGVATGEARFSGSGAAGTAELTLSGSGLEIRSLPVDSIAGRLRWSEEGIEVERLDARAAGLELAGQARLGPGTAPVGATLSFRGDEIGPLLELAGRPADAARGAVEGELSLAGPALDWNALTGSYRVRLHDLRAGTAAGPAFAAEAHGRLADGALAVESLAVTGPGLTGRVRGRWRPGVELGLAGSVEAASWRPAAGLAAGLAAGIGLVPQPTDAWWLGEIDGAVGGRFEIVAPLHRGLEPDKATGWLEARGERIRWTARPGYEVTARLRGRLDGGAPALETGSLQAPGLTLQVEGAGGAGAGRHRVSLAAGDIAPTVSLLAALDARSGPAAGTRPAGWAAAAERLRGSLTLAGEVSGWRPGAGLADLAGTIDLELDGISLLDPAAAAPDAQAPLPGLASSLAASFAGGELAVERWRAALAGIEATATGRLGREGAAGLDVRLAAASLADSVEALRAQLGGPAGGGAGLAWLPPLSGRLSSEARLSGAWRALQATGSLTVEGLRLAGYDLGDLDARAEVAEQRLRYAGQLGRTGQAVEVAGEIALAGGRHDLRLLVEPQPLEPYAEAAGWGGRLQGQIAGRLEIAWPEAEGSIRLDLADAVVAGTPVERLEAEGSFTPNVLEITRGEARLLSGGLSFGGRLGPPTEPSTLGFSGGGLEIGQLVAALGVPVDLSGILSLEGRLLGGPGAPRVEATIALAETRLLGRRTPDLAGPATLDGAGLSIDLAASQPAASLSWAMDFAPDGSWRGAIEHPLHLALDPWLSGEPGGTESILEGSLRGVFEMPAGRPELITGRLGLDGGRVTIADRELRLEGGLEAILEPETARVPRFLLRGEGTELSLEAELTRGAAPTIAGRASGRLDLRALQALGPGLRTGGLATVDLVAAGPWPGFDWRGTVAIQDGAVQHLDFPAAIDRLSARVDVARDDWVLRDLAARLGGGTLSASGSMAMAGLEPAAYRLQMQGDGIRLDYPEGFRSQSDARLVLSGRPDEPAVLTGQVTMLRGLYDRDLDLERSLLARQRGLEAAPEIGRSWMDELTLAFDLRVPEGLWVRNDLASLETRGELEVRGTLSRPRISGRIEALEGGRIVFRDVSYYVTSGSFDYVGGPIEDPRLAIRAETSVAEYDITLTISGRLSDPVFELSSSPSLPTADIVTLLITGSTRDQFVSGAGGLSQAQAAAYLSSGLTKKLEGSLRKSLGLDELKVDPVLVDGQTNPTARVTAGKTITPRLSATYSSRLGTAQRDVYQAKLRLNKRLSLVGTRNDDGSLSADVRYSASRRQARGAQDEAAPTGARPVIREIQIDGGTLADAGQLGRILGLRTGEELRKTELLEGLDKLRGWYLEKRHPEADTTYRVVETEGGVRLEVAVEEGRQVRLRFPEAKRARRLERAILELWSRSLFREDIGRDAATRVEQILARDGFLSAAAESELREPEDGVVEVVLSIVPGPRVRVAQIDFAGHSFFDEKALRQQVLTRPGRLRARWVDPDLLIEDSEAIRALYASAGFIDARVAHRLDFPRTEERAAVTFVVDEGRRFTLAAVRLSGNEQVAGDELDQALGLSLGAPYEDEAVRRAQAAFERLYDRRGFPDALVFIERLADPAAGTVDLVVEIEEGARQIVESVEVDNPGITRESVVRREIELAPGQPLSRELLDASQFRLYRTGLFRSVRVDSLPGEAPHSRRLRFSLEEARNIRTDYGVGFDSEEGARVTANVSHSNVGGSRLHVGAGGRWSPVDRRFQVLVRNPSMGGSRVVGLASAFWEDEERENFNARRRGYSVQLGKEYRDGRISLNAGFDLTDLDDERTAAGIAPLVEGTDARLASLRLGIARSTRDSAFWPTSGSYARAEASVYHSALTSEAEFARLFVQWNRYRTVRGETVWSGGLRAGAARPFGASTELPISERYFAGGETSLRGFGLDSVIAAGTPPEQAAHLAPGESLGGNGLLVLNQELTFPIIDPIYGIVFYDVGNLYWRLGDIDPTDVRHGAGIGLRARSPFGPIRLEYGWKLDRRTGESAGRWHFSLGLAF